MKRYDAIVAGAATTASPAPPTWPAPECGCWYGAGGHVVGGPCAEYEYFPGYRASITNSPGSLEPKVVADLELERHGLKFTHPGPDPDVPVPRRPRVHRMARARRATEQIRQFSARDVEGLRRAVRLP